jgi:hypothetical protein
MLRKYLARQSLRAVSRFFPVIRTGQIADILTDCQDATEAGVADYRR